MSESAQTGVFGGTFNPIHVGHLRAAEEVAEALHLDRMIFVPSGEPPHKTGCARDPIAPAAQRLAWVSEAVDSNPRFEVDAVEVERGGAYGTGVLDSKDDRVGMKALGGVHAWQLGQPLAVRLQLANNVRGHRLFVGLLLLEQRTGDLPHAAVEIDVLPLEI